jgi:hypothetical protein
MIQVRVTLLESFRRFRDEVTETYDTEQSVIDSLSGAFKGNNKTEIGSAFHLIIEKFNTNFCFINGVLFSNDHVQKAINHAENISPFIAEVRQSKTFYTKFGEISITGCTDVLQGNQLRDTKTKFSSPSYLEYFNSFQWRIYLSIFGLDKFYYDIFEFVGYNDGLGKDVSALELKQHEPYECARYENMETDINILINDFLEWIEFRNLWHLLTKI